MARHPAVDDQRLPGLAAAKGSTPPKKVVDASTEYLANQDNIAAWLADGCVEEARATRPLKDLFASWASWCEASGERPGTARALG